MLLRLDTAWFDTDANKLVLVWRGLYATPDDDSPDIAALYVDVEQGETTRPLEEARERFLARIASAELLPMAAMAFPERAGAGAAAAARRCLPAPGAPPARRSSQAAIAAGASLAQARSHRASI